MSRIVRNWREAATLMLCTLRSNNSKSYNDKATCSLKKCGTVPHKNFLKQETDSRSVDILMLKRSSQSQFLPSVYVFPGGISHDSDFSQEWIGLFNSCGQHLNFDKFILSNQKPFEENRPDESVFTRKRNVVSGVPGEVGIRICAIRETFEESGVLIAKHVDDARIFNRNPSLFNTGPISGSTFSSPVLGQWRERVIHEASQFVVMCRDLNIVPDVWSLYEWCNWLTPVINPVHLSKHRRRFDTAFFACCISGSSHAVEDQRETVYSLWSSPELIVESWRENHVGLAGPQLYELSRLLNFENAHALHNFLFEISTHRAERWMGVFCVCKDALLELLPGDSLYPENVNCNKDSAIFRDETHDELKTMFPKRNRVVYSRKPKQGRLLGVDCNVQLHNHVTPRNIIRNQSEPSVE
ncbi:nucleoside diphosphate-linked moiety X motif 19-like [Gigantopelta aegis]|uniref:nucleoside diphosphate-linked moiety X motif 19-like n=1 Tax=Gigantopelta aegis TaxID=1735272 RepID=UPI001B88762D|nr:nucleoside diphosphate-linked moiety X motif 19-like [Gigantopelta aegis]